MLSFKFSVVDLLEEGGRRRDVEKASFRVRRREEGETYLGHRRLRVYG